MSNKERVREEMARRANAWSSPPGTAPHEGGGASRRQHHASGLNQSPEDAVNNVRGSMGSPLHGAVMVRASSSGMGGGSLASGGTMEGPLPSEARGIIYQQCSGEAAEQAETYARRLLSTHRRLKVYRDELTAASEEVDDLKQLSRKGSIVCDALQGEISQIDEKVKLLMEERHLCQIQLQQEQAKQQRVEEKNDQARERVELLRSTIDNIARETQKGQMLLKQLVPNLQIDNYC